MMQDLPIKIPLDKSDVSVENQHKEKGTMSTRRRKIKTKSSGTSSKEISPEKYINRDLSWLEFNRRVLYQVKDEKYPLLERVRFLSIFASNLDEFFMKRVGRLRRLINAGVMEQSPDGRNPLQQFNEIRVQTIKLLQEQSNIYQTIILPKLKNEGIEIISWDDLQDEERKWLVDYYHSQVYPLITPLAVDPGHPFPFISNFSISLAVTLKKPDEEGYLFARIKIPTALPSWILINPKKVQEAKFRFISLNTLIEKNLSNLFSGLEIMSINPFRVIRNSEGENEGNEIDVEDLLELVQETLKERRFSEVVRMDYLNEPDPSTKSLLHEELDLDDDDMYVVHPILDYSLLKSIISLNVKSLKFSAWTPVTPSGFSLGDANIFGDIRKGDILVHHPYESFSESVEKFVNIASKDPQVLGIKMTLYRTGDRSPFIRSLIRAAERGKEVVCLVELQARFDEHRNIFSAKALEDAGVHVVYGIVGFKTHSKTTLVIRKEKEEVRCYAHIGTGNYHTETANLYTDFGLFTCRPEITKELTALFHSLSGYSFHRDYKKLLVSPINMFQEFIRLIKNEIKNKKEGKPARIIAKFNSMEDMEITKTLYEASQAGVEIIMIVRGFCVLRPGVPGQSENIKVISLIGRFLEHSRIYYFADGKENKLDGKFMIGSADWMYRNLHNRVEVITPVDEIKLKEKLWEVLELCMNDHRLAWDLQSDGSYVQRIPRNPEEEKGIHTKLMELTAQKLTFKKT